VGLETDYNSWATPGVAMTKSGSAWQVTTNVPYGKDVQYKFFTNGTTWLVNQSAPLLELPSGPNVNNILQAVTCGSPAQGSLSLVGGSVTTTSASYSFQVAFNPGATAIDTSKTLVTVNGAPAASGTVNYDPSTRTFSVNVSSGVTAPNKYGYVFQVWDMNGQASRLFVPFWVGSTSFEWSDAFMYEIMVDRFVASGTTSKAGPSGPPTADAGNWYGGDYGGVVQKIQANYFDHMGVNTLWISSPVLGTDLCEMGSGANSGHCLSGYHSYFPIATGWTYGSENDPLFTGNGITSPIDPHFGTAADLSNLVNAAHQHGIRVLTDLVVNHVFADQAPPPPQKVQLGPLFVAHETDEAWFNNPYSSSYSDCGSSGSLWDVSDSLNSSGLFNNTWNRADCWFDQYLPDFNTSNPTVNDTIVNHAVWLMEQFNLDGFRVDAAKQVMSNVCVDLRSKVNADISTSLPFYMVGESLGGFGDQVNVFDCVGADRLNGSMDDGLHYSIKSNILQGGSNGGTNLANDVATDEGSSWTGMVPGALMGHFFGSHDTDRAISLAAGDSNGNPWAGDGGVPPVSEDVNHPAAFKALQLAQTFLMTYDPIPVIWMGDEFGQPGTIDPDCRRMMRFDSDLSPDEGTTLAYFQKLGTARAAHSALRRGPRTNLWADATFYADGRFDGTDVTIVALNLDTGSGSRTMNVANIGLTVGTKLTDVLSGATITVASGGTSPDGGPWAQAVTISLDAKTAALFTK
jgi:glycosidase